MNDILLPLAQRYHAVLVASVGFQSVTAAVDLMAGRVARSGKPVRIFYLSDFDPAGDSMPGASARQIEFWRTEYAPESDIKLTPLALTLAQVEHYNLPTIPIKDTDNRKASFLERRHSDATELDALEALNPGPLATLVRTALAPYWDRSLETRCRRVAQEAQDAVQAAWNAVATDHQEELTAIADEARVILEQYQARLTQLNERLQIDLAPLADRLAGLSEDVQHEQDAFAPALPPRPQPVTDPGDESDWLYASERPYLEQLAIYKARRAGSCEEDETDAA